MNRAETQAAQQSLARYKSRNEDNNALCKAMEDVVMQYLGYEDVAPVIIGAENHVPNYQRSTNPQRLDKRAVKDRLKTIIMANNRSLYSIPDERLEKLYKKFLAIVGEVNNDADISENYFCPISCALMEDPVIAEDGHSYERSFIEEWLREHATSPVTREKISHLGLRPNHSLRGAISDLREKSLTANTEYQYEDYDMDAILRSRLLQEELRNVVVLAAIDDMFGNQLQQRLEEDRQFSQNVGRIVMIPCSLGNFHWVGILLEFFDDGRVKRVEYLDSMGGVASGRLQQQLSAVYPGYYFQQRVLLQQNDNSSCGAYVIENLLFSAEHPGHDTNVVHISATRIREKHLLALREYNREFYESFNYRQRHNMSTVTELQQRHITGNTARLSRHEFNRVLNVMEHLVQIHNSYRDQLIEIFGASERYQGDHRSHLNAVRAVVGRIALQISGGDKKHFNNVLRLLFNISEYKADTDLNAANFCLTYEELLVVARVGKNNLESVKHMQAELAESVREIKKSLVQKRGRRLSDDLDVGDGATFATVINSENVTEALDDAHKTSIILASNMNELCTWEDSSFDTLQSNDFRECGITVKQENGGLSVKWKYSARTWEEIGVLSPMLESPLKKMSSGVLIGGSSATAAALVADAAIARSLGAEFIVVRGFFGCVAAVGVVGALQYFAKEKGWNFSASIQKAMDLYNTAIRYDDKIIRTTKIKEAYETLKSEFVQKNMFIRSARWFATSYDEYAVAHLLLGQLNTELSENEGLGNAYLEFELAYTDARNSIIKVASILSLIKLLSDKGRVINVAPNVPMNADDRLQRLDAKIKELNKMYGNGVRHSFEKAHELCMIIGQNIKSRSFFASGTEIKALLSYEASILRYMDPPFGQLWEIVVNCMQALCYIMIADYRKSYPDLYQGVNDHVADAIRVDNSGTKLIDKEDSKKAERGYHYFAQEKFERCSILLRDFNVGQLDCEEKNKTIVKNTVNQIKGVIARSLNRWRQEGVCSLGMFDSIMINLGLNVSSSQRLGSEDILRIFKNATNNTIGVSGVMFVLSQIESSEKIAKIRFEDEHTWLHYLPRVNVKDDVVSIAIQNAVKQVIRQGMSPYERNRSGHTAFMCTPKDDPHKVASIFNSGEAHDLMGVDDQIRAISAFLSETKKNLNRGRFLLLSGPPGVGKTRLVEILAEKGGFAVNKFPAGDQEDKYVGQIEHRVQKFFANAKQKDEPVCLFFDEIDTICPQFEGTPRAGYFNPDKIVTLIQTELDNLKGTKVVAVGATNYLFKLKPAIKSRAGSNVVHFRLPDKEARELIIEHGFRMDTIVDREIISKVAEATAGWSPRQINSYVDLVRERAERERQNSMILTQDFIVEFESSRQNMAQEHERIVKIIVPRLNATTNINSYDGLIALDPTVKGRLDGICLSIVHHERYTSAKVGKRHLILCGPPGTGKTSFAKAIALKTNVAFIIINAGEYKLPGSELAIKEIFAIARGFEKAVVFIDEIDAITRVGCPAKEVIQTEIDGFTETQSTVIVIAATNNLGDIAAPVLDRFSICNVPLPDVAQRKELFVYFLNEARNSNSRCVDLEESLTSEETLNLLAMQSEGLSQRSIAEVMKDAIFGAITRAILNNTNTILLLDDITDAIANNNEKRLVQQTARPRFGGW